MILVFFSLCLGALIGALFRFPWYVLFPLVALFWKRNRDISVVIFFTLLSASLYQIGTVPAGNYELVGYVERGRLRQAKVFQGEWKKIYPVRIETSEEGYIYAIGYFDGNTFHPSYIRKVEKPSFKTLKESFSKMTNGTVLSVLFGEKDRDIYRSGLGHFFAVSGLHIGIAFSLYTTLLSFLTWRRTYQELAALLLLVPYVITVGTPSVIRAYLTILLWVVFKITGFRTTPLHTTATVGSFMMIVDPTVVFTPSFLLSFFVTLCILESKNIFELTVKAYLSALPFLCLFFGGTNMSALVLSIPVSLLMIPVTWLAHLSFLLFLLGLKTSALIAAKITNIVSLPLNGFIKLANLLPEVPLPQYLYFILIFFPLLFLSPDIRDIFHKISSRAIL
ncbi:ComEC/Rec2-related protein [Thermotoga sp. Mc24]|uniref:ComEC/Rec2 family competence protein n=1 Tax=Thermotoga sp. Mc24 TaxID=1231241 RepID=UPI000544029D|nr:ComEC/Rec2 family competence protein [Thermotoga sp. Mc24]KHC92310.1 ComEC/Rec2-related protein [Thermotoga sp. Mc24]